MKKLILLIFVVMMVSSCAEWQAAMAKKGSVAADDVLTAAEYAHCELPSAASLQRKYHIFTDPNNPKAASWRLTCYGSDEVVKE